MFAWFKKLFQKNKTPRRVRRGGRTYTLRDDRYVPDDGGDDFVGVEAMLIYLSDSNDDADVISDDTVSFATGGGGDFAGGGGGGTWEANDSVGEDLGGDDCGDCGGD